jgi:hypothetical protein
MSELILPVSVKRHENPSVVLTSVVFEGAQVVILNNSANAGAAENPDIVVSDKDGVVKSPLDGRYPFTDRLAGVVVAHFEQNGELPDWCR